MRLKFYDKELRRRLSFQEVLIVALQGHLPMNLKKVLTYNNPSFDGLVSLTDVYYNSDKVFPNADQADLEFEDRGKIDLMIDEAGDPLNFFLKEKTLVIGAGGSFLDEHIHPRNRGHHSPNECAATLTAKLTGSDKDPEWRKILRFAYLDDTGRRTDHKFLDASMTLPNLVKMAYDSEEDISDVINSTMKFIHCYHQWLKKHPDDKANNWSLSKLVRIAQEMDEYDTSWVAEAEAMLLAAHKSHETRIKEANKMIPFVRTKTLTIGDKTFKLSLMESDNTAMSCQIFKKLKSDVVIMRRSTGRVQIFSARGKRIDLSECVAELRKAENNISYRDIPARSELVKPGKIEESPLWYYHQCDNDMIFNGSRTTLESEVLETELTNDHIMYCIEQGLIARYKTMMTTTARKLPTFVFRKPINTYQSVSL